MISIVQCPECGWLQASTAVKSFKCRKCNTSRELRKVKIIKVVKDLPTARVIITALRSKG